MALTTIIFLAYLAISIINYIISVILEVEVMDTKDKSKDQIIKKIKGILDFSEMDRAMIFWSFIPFFNVVFLIFNACAFGCYLVGQLLKLVAFIFKKIPKPDLKLGFILDFIADIIYKLIREK